MGTFQQKLLLKGSEESIEYFTKVLKVVKDGAGFNTALAIVESLENWEKSGGPGALCGAEKRQGKLRGLQLALVCGAEMHLKVNLELEKIKRDKMMGLVMMRNKVKREEWLLEAMIVALELYQAPDNIKYITRSDGMRCAVRELRGMSEVRISESSGSAAIPGPATISGRDSRLAEETQKPPIPSRDSSCPPATGWRSRMLREEQEQADRQKEQAEERRKLREMEEEKRKAVEIQERKVIRVRRTSERKKSLYTINSESDYSISETSDKSAARRKKKEKRRILSSNNSPPPSKKSVTIISAPGLKFDLNDIDCPIRSSKERREGAQEVSRYLDVITPEEREMPGFEGRLGKWDRHRHGIDCDEVFPGIFLGNGATVKKKDYLKRIGISHVLNAAEFRGVNVGEDFFSGLKYKGLRVEDTPQTQICRYFMEVAEFLDSAISSKGRCFVNCVFGRSRSTTCVVVYLMLKYDWGALQALRHIRHSRPVEINEGFLQQLADLDFKIKWYKNKVEQEQMRK